MANETKNTTGYANETPGYGGVLTYASDPDTWGGAQGTWGDPQVGSTNESKNAAASTNETKH